MANEVFFDTSGFFVLMDERDPIHRQAVDWLRSRRGKVRPVTTEWVIGEACTLFLARIWWRSFSTISTEAQRCC